MVFALVVALIVMLLWLVPHSSVVAVLASRPPTPISAVRDASSAKIVGQVRCLGEPLLAPLSGTRCVAYRLLVEESVGSLRIWNTLIDETRTSEFLVSDATGTLRVVLAGANLAIVNEPCSTSGDFDRSAAEAAMLVSHGVAPAGRYFKRMLRHHEAVLAEGATVAVAGVASLASTATGTHSGHAHGEPTRRLVLSTRDSKHPLLVSDDPAAWCTPSRPVKRVALVRVAAVPPADAKPIEASRGLSTRR